jgi:hypothetical protein
VEYSASDAEMKMHFLCAVMSFAILISACTGNSSMPKPTVKSLSSEFQNNLPDGVGVDAVISYLNKTGYGDEPGKYNSGDLIDNANNAHLGLDPNTYELKSIIRDVRKSMFVTTNISITFVFDREKRLTDIRVEEVHTGL